MMRRRTFKTIPTKGKFNAKKVVLADGTTFDSKLEYNRWLFLKDCEKKGIVKDIERQVEFTLLPNQYKHITPRGKRGQLLKSRELLVCRKCCYMADFVYKALVDDVMGVWVDVVEDTKSLATMTPEYRIKKKMMFFFHHVLISEVTKASQPIIKAL